MYEEAKKIKKNEKKRNTSVNPNNAVKSQIFNNKKNIQNRKISYQVGDNYEPLKVNLNPIKVSLRKASIDQ